jgi:hypothetical protein
MALAPGGPLGPAGMGGPLAPGRMASPETTMRPVPGGAEGRTVLSSPLADRLGGPLMQQQKMQATSRQFQMALQMLRAVADSFRDTDPKMAGKLYNSIGGLMKAFPPVQPAPTSVPGVGQLASQMPAQGGMPRPGIPPAVPGTSPLSGPLQGR